MSISLITKYKQTNATLDYIIDLASLRNGNGYSNYLDDGETIYSATASATGGITVSAAEIVNNSSSVRVWVSGGTANSTYTISITVQTTTTSGVYRREDVFQFLIKCL
ncbi:MAG: hypothetical protein KIT59_01190 [Nitrosomonas sp.]|nr:hypothetical protein [Nitrosomonas sp.]